LHFPEKSHSQPRRSGSAAPERAGRLPLAEPGARVDNGNRISAASMQSAITAPEKNPALAETQASGGRAKRAGTRPQSLLMGHPPFLRYEHAETSRMLGRGQEAQADSRASCRLAHAPGFSFRQAAGL